MTTAAESPPLWTEKPGALQRTSRSRDARVALRAGSRRSGMFYYRPIAGGAGHVLCSAWQKEICG